MGKYRLVSTKPMPGTRWINLLIHEGCRVEICTQKKTILSVEGIIALIGDKYDGVIGQLTEDWGDVLYSALSRAGAQLLVIWQLVMTMWISMLQTSTVLLLEMLLRECSQRQQQSWLLHFLYQQLEG